MVKLYVKQRFADKETKVIYEQGQIIEVTEERFHEIAENLGADFVAKVTIEELGAVEPIVVAEPETPDIPESVEESSEFPKSTGGGYYELSDGSKVRGKDAALEAENTLLMR